MMLNRRRHKQTPETVEIETPSSQFAEKESIDFNSLTKKQIKEELDKRGIEYDGGDTKSNLLKLLRDSV